MLDGKFEALPPDSWKPFGNGMRGCIGRPFAWQESLLVVATASQTVERIVRFTDMQLFQNFDFRPHDANYQLVIKASLTIKPGHLYMHVSPRKDVKLPVPSLYLSVSGDTDEVKQTETSQASSSGPPLAIYYGKLHTPAKESAT